MTKRGQAPLPLIFHSVQHMKELSNKTEPLALIFKHMDYRKLGRIDAMELLSCIMLCIDGTFEAFLKNIILTFGFSDQNGGG